MDWNNSEKVKQQLIDAALRNPEVGLGDQDLTERPSSKSEMLPGSTSPIEGLQQDISTAELAKKIEKTIDEFIRPALQMDGGDIEIVKIKGPQVYCRLKGMCAGCAGASFTLKMMVERTLQDQVDERIEIVAI
jgi:Fe-S cluster biogenesis protein NfuA